MKVQLSELKDLTKQALTHYGYNEQEVATIAEVLLYAQLRGNNQGVVKLIGPGIPNKATQPVETLKETPASAYLDAHQNHAMLAVNQATDTAIEKAKASGIAVVGVHGINTSSGAIGFYARKIAREGLVGLVFTAAMGMVAAEGTFERTFGTNPLAIGVPAKDKPLVLDMATAAMALFGVIEAKTAGKSLPEGVAYDSEGQPTTEPSQMLDGGALRTFGGHKGSHLSMMIQALAGPLVGAAFMGEGDMENNWAGHLIVAIDPEVLGGREHVQTSIDTLIQKVKASKKLPGVEEILMPSERGDRMTAVAEQTGEVDIEDNLYQELKKVAQSESKP